MANWLDLMATAADHVEFKGTFARIKHSGFFHSSRSAMSSKGSAASKGGKVVLHIGKAALGLIPIPVVGNIASALADLADSSLRKRSHNSKLAGAK